MRAAGWVRWCVALLVAVSAASAENPSDFTVLPAAGGPPFILSQERGKVVVLHFLLPGDAPECRYEVRDYVALALTTPTVVHIFLKPDADDSARKWVAAMPSASAKWVYRDTDSVLAERYGVRAGYRFGGRDAHYPTIVALDTTGQELFRHVSRGYADRLATKEFSARLADALLTGKKFCSPRGDALADAFNLSLHEPLIAKELALDPAQAAAVAKLAETLGEPLWRLRDAQLIRPEQSAEAWRLVDACEREVRALLRPEQRARLGQLLAQARGLDALLAPAVIEQLQLTDDQVQRIGQIRAATREGSRLMRQLPVGGAPTSAATVDARIEEYQAKQRTRLLAVLRSEQNTAFERLPGKPFDWSGVRTRYARAPELRGVTQWLNGEATTLASLRGKVVALQFFTVGCINCVHNQPPVLGWQQRFADRDVVVLGIHTPETEGERDLANVRRGLTDQGIDYRVAVDNDKANWDAWANHTWPAVYLIDRDGYVRGWWYGELNWQGAGGEKLFGDKIGALLDEAVDPTP